MDFADELRNLPEKELKIAWRDADAFLFAIIRNRCRDAAEAGMNSTAIDLQDFAKAMDKAYLFDPKVFKYRTIAHDNWGMLRGFFYHTGDQQRYYDYYGMSECDAEKLALYTKNKLIQTGLTVDCSLKCVSEKTHFKKVHIESTTFWQKLIYGKKGYDEDRAEKTEKKYTIIFKISW